jgi:hypothetical protein
MPLLFFIQPTYFDFSFILSAKYVMAVRYRDTFYSLEAYYLDYDFCNEQTKMETYIGGSQEKTNCK